MGDLPMSQPQRHVRVESIPARSRTPALSVDEARRLEVLGG
jgi:hypothetical protein